jgi:hypothetical protein
VVDFTFPKRKKHANAKCDKNMKSSIFEIIVLSSIISIIIIFSVICTSHAVAQRNLTSIINDNLLAQPSPTNLTSIINDNLLAQPSPTNLTSIINDNLLAQPSKPLVGTFYYGWFKGKDGNYQAWDISNHKPPSTWASNYLPSTEPGVFNPAHELYDSNDTLILQKQLGWMKKAGIQFGISSWWGIGSTTDKVFSHIIKGFMPSAVNPYPAFRWTMLYEIQAYARPKLNEITTDLNYIKNIYASSPYYLKIDGKPVIFVYNANNSGSRSIDDILTWSMARNLTGFYVVMKVNPRHVGENAHSIDGWYEYDPTKRYDQQDGYYAYVSPGYWKYNETPTLARSPSDFETAVQKLAAASVDFKLIETWNEWAEGTQVEPGQSILHANDDSVFKPSAPSYGDVYLNILGSYFASR